MTNSIPIDSNAPPDPDQDGVTHINAHYNFARTPLGRQLSTYHVARFEHPYFGTFKSVEGFMLFVQTGCIDSHFRFITGAQAKAYYREQTRAGKLTVQVYDNVKLMWIMRAAILAKHHSHPVIAEAFYASTLPFDYYYLEGSGKLPVRPPDAWILTTALNTLWRETRAGTIVVVPTDAEYKALVIR